MDHGDWSCEIFIFPESPLYTFFSHFWLIFVKKCPKIGIIWLKIAKIGASVSFVYIQASADMWWHSYYIMAFLMKILPIFGIFKGKVSFWRLNYVKNWHSGEPKISRLQSYWLGHYVFFYYVPTYMYKKRLSPLFQLPITCQIRFELFTQCMTIV